MNTLLVFVALFVSACMADVSHIVDHKPQIAILRRTQDASPDGSFQHAYETENGISAQAEGTPDGEAKGSYKYVSPEGETVEIFWTAGVEGFKASGASVPETPPHVLRTAEYNAAHPYKEPTSP